jgi:hypothetical protein
MSEETMTDNAAAEAEAAGVAAETGETEETGVSPAALLTAEQVARALGISTRRLRDWRKEGRLTEVGRFRRGTARIPLFDPADVIRLQREQVTEEAPAATVATVATVADHAAFAEAVARQVRLLVAERAEAEAAAVAPLVALVRDQQETIDELRRRAAAAEAERDRLAAQAAQDGAGAQEPPEGAQIATPGVWGRVRRWWRGGGGMR